jgi:hypothetical protein
MRSNIMRDARSGGGPVDLNAFRSFSRLACCTCTRFRGTTSLPLINQHTTTTVVRLLTALTRAVRSEDMAGDRCAVLQVPLALADTLHTAAQLDLLDDVEGLKLLIMAVNHVLHRHPRSDAFAVDFKSVGSTSNWSDAQWLRDMGISRVMPSLLSTHREAKLSAVTGSSDMVPGLLDGGLASECEGLSDHRVPHSTCHCASSVGRATMANAK